jgi:hypothetical protein
METSETAQMKERSPKPMKKNTSPRDSSNAPPRYRRLLIWERLEPWEFHFCVRWPGAGNGEISSRSGPHLVDYWPV